MSSVKKGIKYAIVISLVVVLWLSIAVVLVRYEYCGVYSCDSYEELGIEFSLKLDMKEFTLTMGNSDSRNTLSGKYRKEGNEIVLECSEEDMRGIYDKKNGSITINGFKFSKK
ncbi:MAG: hypothetical protein NC393_10340 [Clostridium sp.]|nr:hypothetical protein [Clostridium sp.]